MSIKRQSEIILWLSRLSKYTLVDVFAVSGVLVGVQLQLNVGGTDAVISAEPRFGIIVSRYYVHLGIGISMWRMVAIVIFHL